MIDTLRRTILFGWILSLLGFSVSRAESAEQPPAPINPNKERCPSCEYWERMPEETREEMGYPEHWGLCFYNPPNFQGFSQADIRGWCRHHTKLPHNNAPTNQEIEK